MRLDPNVLAVLAAMTRQPFTCQRNTRLTNRITLPEHGISHNPVSVL